MEDVRENHSSLPLCGASLAWLVVGGVVLFYCTLIHYKRKQDIASILRPHSHTYLSSHVLTDLSCTSHVLRISQVSLKYL